MPRDSELGLDPYQQRAITCARQGAGLCVILVLLGNLLYTNALALSDNATDASTYRLAGGAACLTGLACCALANKKLRKEDIAWADCGV